MSSPYVSGNQSIYQSPKGDNIGQNYTRAGDPRVDALFPQLNAATDAGAGQGPGQPDRHAAVGQTCTRIPLYQKPTFIAYNSNYTGIEENAIERRSAVGRDEVRPQGVTRPQG